MEHVSDSGSKLGALSTAPSVEPTDAPWWPQPTRPSWSSLHPWLALLAVVVAGLTLLGMAAPLVAPVDHAAFEAINELGYGPDWVFELLDPHERIYRGILLLAIVAAFVRHGPWVTLGVAVAVMSSATISYLSLEAIALLSDRPRPQEVFEDVLTPPGVDWLQASYPSGHATVTTAMAATTAFTSSFLRWPMIAFALVIAWSRIAFGAHFPLDVVAAVALGYTCAAFAVVLTADVGLLPQPRRDPRTAR